MTTAAADGHEADDLFLCFFPAQTEFNLAETDWELARGDSPAWIPDSLGEFSNHAVECNCACK